MKRLYPVILFLIFLGLRPILAETITVSGEVSGTWSADTVLVVGEVRVPVDSTLVIEPGVEVFFRGFYKFIVDGYLEAVGTEADSIVFAAANPQRGWRGIQFIDAPDNSHLSFCIIRHGRAVGNWPNDCGGAVRFYGSSPIISHCLIERNTASDGGGIYCVDCNPVIENCTIKWNSSGSGGGIYCEGYDTNPVINNCMIIENRAFGGGGIYCDIYSEGVISNCTISQNLGGGIYCYKSLPVISDCSIDANSGVNFQGGGIRCSYYASPAITYCNISENLALSGGGIYCWYAHPTFLYCTLSGNSATAEGGGIHCYGSDPVINNCTISGNSAGSWGGGIAASWGSDITVVNTIVEGNYGSGGVYFDDVSSPFCMTNGDFYGNQGGNFTGSVPPDLGAIVGVNANGDSCDVFYNIFEDPLFEDPSSGNFQITWASFPIPDSTKSPCIDAGDPHSPFDPDSTIADIGALYFDQSAPDRILFSRGATNFAPTECVLFGTHPNPFNPTTTISFTLPQACFVKLEIFDVTGRNVGARHAVPLIEGHRNAGTHTVTFNAKNLASGIYLCRLEAGHFSATQKMVLIK